MMRDKTKNCKCCIHCKPRESHEGSLLNTDGEYVCMVIGSLIPEHYYENSSLCTGVYFDPIEEI